jgi:hypothetical protein
MTRKIVFFGASQAARDALRDWPVDLPIAYVVDNDRGKWGGTFEGLSVKNPAALDAEPFDTVFIVVASCWFGAIARQLEAMGLIRDRDFSPSGDAVGLLRRGACAAISFHDAVVMQVEDHWFGIDYERIRDLCAQGGIRYVAARVPCQDEEIGRVTTDRTGYQSLKYLGVPLYDACLLDLCAACGVTPDHIDPADPSHWSAIVHHLRSAAHIVAVARKALDDVRPDAVVIPSGHTTLGAAYRYLAVLRGIRVLALENSLNDARLVWDDLSGIAVNRIPARNYYWRWADLVDDDEAIAHVAAYLASIKTGKHSDHRSPPTPWTGSPTPGRTVLYLANVLNDSSVIFNSRVGSGADAIKATARWALEHGCTFVLKIHPRERPGSPTLHRPLPRAEYSYEGLTLRALQDDRAFWSMISCSAHCVIDADNRYDTYDLIRRSDVCVTVCSQSGLEAAMMGKETVLLGDAYYGGLGFTHDVQHIDRLGFAIAQALDPARHRVVDPRKIAKFFYIFDQVYCVEKSADGVAALIRRTLGRERLPVLPATA